MSEPVDLGAIERENAARKARRDAATPGPWRWGWEDESLLHLTGDDAIFNHVLSISPCPSCQEGVRRALEQGKASTHHCLGPNDRNAALIAAARTDEAPERIDALLALVREARDRAKQEGHGKRDAKKFCPQGGWLCSWCKFIDRTQEEADRG